LQSGLMTKKSYATKDCLFYYKEFVVMHNEMLRQVRPYMICPRLFDEQIIEAYERETGVSLKM